MNDGFSVGEIISRYVSRFLSPSLDLIASSNESEMKAKMPPSFVRREERRSSFLFGEREIVIISGLLCGPPLGVLISKCDRALATRQYCDNNTIVIVVNIAMFEVYSCAISRRRRDCEESGASSLAPETVSYPIVDDISICHGLSFVDVTAIRGSEYLAPTLP